MSMSEVGEGEVFALLARAFSLFLEIGGSGGLDAAMREKCEAIAREMAPMVDGDGEERRATMSLVEATRHFQRRHLLAVLRAHDWNVTSAARELDVGRSYLHKLINDFDLKR